MNVSRICMGCMGFGDAKNGQHSWTLDEEHSREIVKRGLDLGVTKGKYDATARQDSVIIGRVAELAEKHKITMTEVALAWLLTKVTAPVVGATKLHHIEGAAKAVDLKLPKEELLYLEEAYVPHKLVGVMAQNIADASGHVWSAGNQKM